MLYHSDDHLVGEGHLKEKRRLKLLSRSGKGYVSEEEDRRTQNSYIYDLNYIVKPKSEVPKSKSQSQNQRDLG